VALIALLRQKATQKDFIVCTTHISSDFTQPQVQLTQTQTCLSELQMFSLLKSLSPIPIILCGDFNALPGSAVYRLLSDGYVPPEHPDCSLFEVSPQSVPSSLSSQNIVDIDEDEEEETKELPPVALGHSLKLQSAYRMALGSEPPFTNLHGPTNHGAPAFIGTLDYIWYTPGLKLHRILEIPPKNIACANDEFPPNYRHVSDHFPLLAAFSFE